ncbi:type I secretion system permease/ATPase [Frigidibacter oleivorans]|uniref:type I secretion system permease/ATPase n=1 Tax=Frigidibacter oleivorans TaxID=2487129 RepID=UPI000F8C9B5B|nr:type I secretion system permease/ATPase [Frigidibacter oleivorans]
MTTLAGGRPATATAYGAALSAARSSLIAVAGFSLVINLLMLTGSIYMLQVYDRVLTSGSVPTLAGLFLIVVVLYLFLAFYDFLRSRVMSRLATRLDVAAAEPALLAWVDARRGPGGGDAGGRPLRDLDTVRGFVGSPVASGLFDLPFAPVYLAVLFLLHPWLGWLTLAGGAVAALIALANRALSNRSIARAVAAETAERDFADQCWRGAEPARAMGMQDRLAQHWSVLRRKALAETQRGSDAAEVLSAASRAFRMLLQSAILTLGAFLVLRQEMSAGAIVASSILSGRALAPVDQITGQWRSIGAAAAAHRRLRDLFAALPDLPRAIQLPPPAGALQVDRLVKLGLAGATGERRRILNDVSFALEPGEGLGVIGPSASGKSTLARLLVGAWTADQGEIRLDGATADQWAPAALGRHVGYLPQTVELLPGTLRDNIARFDPAARDADVIAAARLAGVHEMILSLPQGYATQVGAQGAGGGAPLSGGQVQRIGLARAIFGLPKLVVLDEPNANLDMAGDEALTAAITELRARGSIVIVMAHRPSALAAVNRILLLRNGAVARFGPKDEVLAPSVRGRMATQSAGAATPPVAGEPAIPAALRARQVPAMPHAAAPAANAPVAPAVAPEPAGPSPMTGGRVAAKLARLAAAPDRPAAAGDLTRGG